MNLEEKGMQVLGSTCLDALQAVRIIECFIGTACLFFKEILAVQIHAYWCMWAHDSCWIHSCLKRLE